MSFEHRCGASSYGRSDWKGKGCGLDFCDVCESPLKESKCQHSRCFRPERAQELKAQREKLKVLFAEFQKFYLDIKSRKALLEAAEEACRACRLDELSHQLIPMVIELYIKGRQARAYAVVALAFEQNEEPKGQVALPSTLRMEGLRLRCRTLEGILNALAAPLAACLRSTIISPIIQVWQPAFFPISCDVLNSSSADVGKREERGRTARRRCPLESTNMLTFR